MRERIATAPTSAANRWSVRANESIGANRVLTGSELDRFQVVQFTPTGVARDLTLPAESASAGAYLIVINTAATALNVVVKDDGGATIVTVAQNKAAMVWCNGTAWLSLLGA